MSGNPFDDLQREFRDAYAKYGDDDFFLFAFTKEELDARWERIKESGELLGAVPLSKNGAGVQTYWIVGTILRGQEDRGTLWEEPCDVFKALAARAGAFLPAKARQLIPVEPEGPVSWWLSYLWWRKPPTDEDLKLLEKRVRGRPIWLHPFFESVNAIEQDGLCGDTRPQAGGEQAAASKAGTDVRGAERTGASGGDGDTADIPPLSGAAANAIPGQSWLRPTSMADLANRLGNIGIYKAKSILKPYGLKNHGDNRQLWTVRLDNMPINLRKQIERA